MRAPAKIMHQKQPTNNSCIITCLAMLAEIPVAYAIDKYHYRVWSDDRTQMLQVFDELGIVAVPCSSMTNHSYWGELYLLGAQSLNNTFGSHQIILDLTAPTRGRVIDPQKGNNGIEYYKEFRDDCDGHPLVNFNIDYRILECPAWPA